MTKSHKMTFAAVATMAVALSAVLLVSSVPTPAEAKIRDACENPAEKEPAGQQPNCRGEGLTDVRKNPAGKKPPGQQPE